MMTPAEHEQITSQIVGSIYDRVEGANHANIKYGNPIPVFRIEV